MKAPMHTTFTQTYTFAYTQTCTCNTHTGRYSSTHIPWYLHSHIHINIMHTHILIHRLTHRHSGKKPILLKSCSLWKGSISEGGSCPTLEPWVKVSIECYRKLGGSRNILFKYSFRKLLGELESFQFCLEFRSSNLYVCQIVYNKSQIGIW